MENPPEVLLETRRFRVIRQQVVRADGQTFTHESIQHPGAVVILPFVDADHICLIRNFRPAIGRWLLELPAGTLEPGEPPEATARRELQEETGYTCRKLKKLHTFFMSPGILHEQMHLFLATDLTAGSADLQPDEQIQTEIVPWREAVAMAADGRIEDAKTLVAILLWAVGGKL